MSVLEVLKFPDPRLRKKSKPVKNVTDELKRFSQDMVETMYSFKGIGLSAPQVNKLVRLLVTDTRPRDIEGRYDLEEMTELEKAVEQPLIIFNPEIVSRRGKTTFNEGCLSLPSYYEIVDRYEWIEVQGLDANGQGVKFETDGLLSICIQHEIDHLDGKLFIDRLSPIKANRIKSRIKKFGYPDPKEQEDKEVEL